jgi:hypothetical protein
MRTAYAALAHGLPSGNCASAAGQGSYTIGSSPRPAGHLACFASSQTGQHLLVWTDRRLDILSVAASQSLTHAELYRWWQGDSGPERGPVGSAATQPHPLNGITATLAAYFDAINARKFGLAWSQLSPAEQSAIPYSALAAGDSTTTIAGWKVNAITPGPRPGTYIASVTFRSYQNPSKAPNGLDSCDDWTLDYTMIPTSGRWLIDHVNPLPGVPGYQSCG